MNQFKYVLNDFSILWKFELSFDIFISVGLLIGDIFGLGVYFDMCIVIKMFILYDNVFIIFIENG